MLPNSVNRGFYGVKENELVTDADDLNSLVKYYNGERARSITEGNPLDCDSKEWTIYDWYANNQCIEQRNTDHLEKALESKGVKPDKFPIFFGSGNMASLLTPLLFDSSPDYETEFNFNPKTGLRLTAPSISAKKVGRSVVGKYGHIVERFVTSEENVDIRILQDSPIEIGRELIYLMNSLEFPDSDAPLNAENACEVKAYNGGLPTEYGIKHIQLLVKSFALGGIRRLAMVTIENFTTISKIENIDIETELNKNRTLESFYACLNNFAKLIMSHCLENNPKKGFVETFRRGNESFMIIKDEEHFWCYLFDINSANFSDGLKFPNSLSAIRWPLEQRCPFFDRAQINNIQKYSFEAPNYSNQVLHHAEGNCLLVVRNNSELDLAPTRNFEYKISMENPIFHLVEEILLKRYYARNRR